MAFCLSNFIMGLEEEDTSISLSNFIMGLEEEEDTSIFP